MGITNGWEARYIVFPQHVGYIIGKRGGNVMRIRDQTHCQILIQEPDEYVRYDPNCPYFLVRGLFKRNVTRALEMLHRLATKARGNLDVMDVPSENSFTVGMVSCSYFVVHPDHVGVILGARGQNVARLSQEYGAFIYIQEGNVATGGMPWFQIKGLFQKNIERAYFALSREAQRAEMLIPRINDFLSLLSNIQRIPGPVPQPRTPPSRPAPRMPVTKAIPPPAPKTLPPHVENGGEWDDLAPEYHHHGGEPASKENEVGTALDMDELKDANTSAK